MLNSLGNKFVDLIHSLTNQLNLTSPMGVVLLILDITIVALIAYYIFVLIKKTRAEHIFRGILILIILLVVSKILNLVILNFLLTNFISYGMLLFIVVFQPELRSAFEKIGRSKIVDVFDMDDNLLVKHTISEIVKAVEILSLKKIGAIMVLERHTKISEFLKEGVNLSAKVSNQLLQNIFMPRTPLHDGAVIIDGNQILAAKCVLPLASERAVEKFLGTRHRAAVGISEISDAIVIVISEETGTISVAEEGKLKRGLTSETLRDLLIKKLDRTKTHRILNKKNVENK